MQWLTKCAVVDLAETLAKLKELGIRSLMVEGGATVIATFLDMREPDDRGADKPIVDMHIVTVAPVMIGAVGVQAGALISKVRRLIPPRRSAWIARRKNDLLMHNDVRSQKWSLSRQRCLARTRCLRRNLAADKKRLQRLRDRQCPTIMCSFRQDGHKEMVNSRVGVDTPGAGSMGLATGEK